MHVIAIDPGYEISAWVLYDGRRVLEHAIETNDALMARLGQRVGALNHVSIAGVVLESIESFGMAVGRETFETVFVTGRMFEIAKRSFGPVVERMPRRTVKLHLCQSARAQDTNIRVAIHDRFGGKAAAVGLKRTPGPLFGLKSHEYSALAIAITWTDQHLARKAG